MGFLVGTRIRAYGPACRGMRDRSFPLSSIRTFTVGFGFQPNLLTPPALSSGRALAGSGMVRETNASGHYRRWGFPPRPENVHRLNRRQAELCRYGTVSPRGQAIRQRDGAAPAAHGSATEPSAFVGLAAAASNRGTRNTRIRFRFVPVRHPKLVVDDRRSPCGPRR